MSEGAIKQIVDAAEEFQPEPSNRLRVYTAHELLALEIPPREYLLYPILPKAGLGMLFAPRGVGKTWTALGIACAVATGTAFLRWKAEKPYRVLYIDGEMPSITIQERLAATLAAIETEPPEPHYLRIITPDAQTGAMPDIGTDEGQAMLEPYLTDIDLIIVDNLACLVRTGKSNEEEAWRPVQSWALGLRRRGIAVLFIHHAGKGGDQRGSSAREDILDTVMKLSRASDYNPTEGAKFIVEITKGRGIFGDDAASFEAKLESRKDAAAIWTTRPLEDARAAQIQSLSDDGLSQRDIAKELNIAASTVNRHLKRLKEVQNNGSK